MASIRDVAKQRLAALKQQAKPAPPQPLNVMSPDAQQIKNRVEAQHTQEGDIRHPGMPSKYDQGGD